VRPSWPRSASWPPASAHELNNPLATVAVRLESVLARTPADDPRRRPLEVVEQEADRMAGLVANLLQFSRRARTGSPPWTSATNW